MKKYLVYFLQTVNEFIIYRFRFFFTAFFQFVTPLTMIWVFTVLSGNKFAGMSRDQIIYYYVLTSFLCLFTSSKVDDFVKIAIQEGNLGRYLVKPIHFWIISLISDTSQRFIKWAIGLPIFVLIFYFSGLSVFSVLQQLSLSIISILIISLVLTFAFSFSLGLLTFWLEELWGWQNLKEISILLLSGIALPYQFFPSNLVNILGS